MDIEVNELATVVAALTGSSELGAWKSERIYEPVASASAGVWRVTGEGWSVVMKLIAHDADGHPRWQSGEGEGHWYYWRREVLAYESDLLTSLRGGLRAPTCYLVAERADGGVALWLEDVSVGVPAQEWSLDEYRVAARHLGHAQGYFLCRGRVPQLSWLSQDWMRSYLELRDGDFVLLSNPVVWTLPAVRDGFPAILAGPLARMRAERADFLHALDGLPQTVCHLDLHPANMFSVGDATVLIDWSFVGVAALGLDAGSLVPDAALDFHVDPADLDELFELVLDGYVEGLREAGWDGPADSVRLAMSATAATKYAWIAPSLLRAVVERRDQLNRRPMQETMAAWVPTIDFLLRKADEARSLMAKA